MSTEDRKIYKFIRNSVYWSDVPSNISRSYHDVDVRNDNFEYTNFYIECDFTKNEVIVPAFLFYKIRNQQKIIDSKIMVGMDVGYEISTDNSLTYSNLVSASYTMAALNDRRIYSYGKGFYTDYICPGMYIHQKNTVLYYMAYVMKRTAVDDNKFIYIPTRLVLFVNPNVFTCSGGIYSAIKNTFIKNFLNSERHLDGCTVDITNRAYRRTVYIPKPEIVINNMKVWDCVKARKMITVDDYENFDILIRKYIAENHSNCNIL